MADKYKELERRLDDLEDQITRSMGTSEETQAKVAALREVLDKMKVCRKKDWVKNDLAVLLIVFLYDSNYHPQQI